MKFKLTIPKTEIEFEAESVDKAFEKLDNGSVSVLEKVNEVARLTSEVCLLCSTRRKPMSYPDDDYRCSNETCALYNRVVEK